MTSHKIARYALAFVWLATAAVSLGSGRQIGYAILAEAGIEGAWADLCVYGGAILDLLLGIWTLLGVAQLACWRAQSMLILLYTVLLTLIAPAFWLHPFGPLIKNIPMLALIHLLYQQAGRRAPA
jgi:hypothetical protein